MTQYQFLVSIITKAVNIIRSHEFDFEIGVLAN